MKSETAITVESLSKTYRLYGSHRDRMKEFFHPLRKRYHTKHHALKEISFSLQKGEVLGVVGHNGSGKSTLLKILASVVSPTSGHYRCNGRVTALLELGGGFNLEMTGVENIYFIGALQGFRKKEMKKRVDAILDFAEIGEYAYQPVKSYSSGMYVRLAFSMNININPEILIIDEALSVGDIRFQQKCYRKIKEIKESGKTIVFCSHSTGAVKDFCTRAIWINKGEIMADGDPLTVTDNYQVFMSQTNLVTQAHQHVDSTAINELLSAPGFEKLKWISLDAYAHNGDGQAQIHYAAIADAESGESITKANLGQKIKILSIAYTDEKIVQPGFQLTMHGNFSSELFKINTHYYKQAVTLPPGKPTIICTEFTLPNLANGTYTFSLALTSVVDGRIDFIFNVNDGLNLTVDIAHPAFNMGTQLVVPDAKVYNMETENIKTDNSKSI
jgi:ABC-type polysaccharide/polyol phosphate transport system ATPase subunit